MIQTLLGTKLGMTSSYDSRGRRVGATMVKVEPNFITQVKTTKGKDGYNSIQLGYSEKKSVKKPQIGHLKKAGIDKKVRWLREVRIMNQELGSMDEIKPGTEINLGQVFSVGDSVKVTGISKGRGFQGGVKRHGFHGGPKTHGQSDRHRAPGSIGAGTTPGRVYKGKKMAGHMGVETVSYKNLEVLGVDKDILTIKGGVPGPIGALVRVENIGQIKGYTAPPEEKPDEEGSEQVTVDSGQENTEAVEESVTASDSEAVSNLEEGIASSTSGRTRNDESVEGEQDAS